MGAKPQLSPNERLARKRAAARMRQQRCRARKRQALLEQKRIQREQMSRSEAEPISTQHASSAFRMRRPTDGEVESALPTSTQQPIYKVVSFESQRSFEEANKGPSKSPVDTIVTVSSPPRKTADVTSITSADSSAATPVPDKEAAAIAAMLSLKSPPSEKKVRTPQRVEMRPREQQRPARSYGVPISAKVPLYKSYNNIRYEKARYAMPPQRVPHYYMGMSHPPPPPRPHPQYRYGYHPSAYHRYVRYD
ncbi:unnamed protein product [Cylindrotheca closterium]|uniref:Uncharacterized protein n=1 Tax=Cylindrotheca closterium TaxID=2856 RepID=A0AAD2GAG4_9STRA|nr:unnamed protein product [Cylindrotheca closterium]